MSGPGRPRHPAHGAQADVAALEQARQVTRELHEAIKDARALLREMHAVRNECDELVVTAVADMHGNLREIQSHMDGQTEILRQAILTGAGQIEELHAELLGFDSAEALLLFIVRKMLDHLQDPIIEVVTARLPALVETELDRITATASPRKRRVIALHGGDMMRAAGVEPAPPGAFVKGSPAQSAAKRAAQASRTVPPPAWP